MANTDVVYVNGRDLNDLGLVVLDYGERWSGLRYKRDTALPFRVAGGFPDEHATVEPKVFTIQTALEGETRTSRRAQVETIHNWMQGLCEVKFGDSEDRVIYGVVERSRGSARWSELAEIKSDLALTFDVTCYNPVFWDTSGSVVAFDSTARDVALGSLPSGGIITLMGSATNPTITYRDHRGTSIETLGFTVTLASDEYLEINLDTMQVTKYDSGVSSDGLSLLTSGWFFYPSPEDGDVEGTSYPTLEVDSGTAAYNYWKAYE